MSLWQHCCTKTRADKKSAIGLKQVKKSAIGLKQVKKSAIGLKQVKE